MTMENTENKSATATIINGVVLTDRAINYLKGLQQDDNAQIKDIRDELKLPSKGFILPS